jgi:hypothetical protein
MGRGEIAMPNLCSEHPENPHWLSLISKARETNHERDLSDKKMGFGSPTSSLFHGLRTGLEAISCGICMEDFACVAEGFVMLQHVENMLRPLLLLMEKSHIIGEEEKIFLNSFASQLDDAARKRGRI